MNADVEAAKGYLDHSILKFNESLTHLRGAYPTMSPLFRFRFNAEGHPELALQELVEIHYREPASGGEIASIAETMAKVSENPAIVNPSEV
jgi:hypothetical protein